MHLKRLATILILICLLLAVLIGCTTTSSVTITFDSTGGTKIASRSIAADLTELVLPEPTREGYDFSGWYYDSSYSTLVDKKTIPTESLTIFAKWTIKKITITFKNEQGSAIDWLHIDYGSTVTLGDLPQSPVKTGYTGAWHTVEGTTVKGKVTANDLTDIKANFTLIASYTVNLGSVAYYVSDQDLDPNFDYLSVDGANIEGYKLFSHDIGIPELNIAVPANPVKEGFYFLGWFFDKEHTEKCVSLPENLPYANLTLYAHFMNVSEMYKYMTYETFTLGGENVYRVTGLTAQGKNQDTIVIPSEVDGKKVVALGRDYTTGTADSYRIFNSNYLTSITIPDTVTSIGSFAFLGNSRLKTVTVDGNRLLSIGTGAFAGCNLLKEINLPDSVVTIGDYAFAGITKTSQTNASKVEFYQGAGEWSSLDDWYPIDMALEKFNIKNTSMLNNLKAYAFYNTALLRSISLPNSLTEVNYTMFDGSYFESIIIYGGNTDLVNVGDAIYSLDLTILFYYPMYGDPYFTLHNNTTTIYSHAFYNNKTVTTVDFNNGLTSIGAYAFENAKLLTSITMGNSSITSIGAYAFSGCVSLSEVRFPAYLNTLGEGAFKNCNNISAVTFLGNSLNAIPRYTFYGCESIENLVIPSNVKSIGDYAFYGCSSLETIDMNEESSIMTAIGSYSFSECVNLEPFTLPYNIVSIGSFAFASAESIMDVQVDLYNTRLTQIGAYAFKNCGGMSVVTLPSTLQNIGEGAFENCTGLFSVSLSSASLLTEIPARLFYNCIGIRNTVIFSSNYQKIGDMAFYNCTSLTEITLNNITSIGVSAFENCTNLREGGNINQFILPANLATLGERAFANCTNLTSIHIPNTLLAISKEAFINCTRLATINYNSGYILKTIGESAFAYCTSLVSFEIPSTLEIRGAASGFIKNPFFGCSALLNFTLYQANVNNLVVNNGIVFEKTLTFEGTQLYSLYAYPTGRGAAYDISTNVTFISDYAFYGSAIPALSFTSSTPEPLRELITLVKIGKYAFASCANLSSVSLSKRVYEVDSYAFYNCKALTSLSIEDSYAASGSETETSGVFYEVTNLGENPSNNNLLTIGDYAFAKIGIAALQIAPRIININKGAFSDCYSLLAVEFIDSFDTNLLTIGDYAFYADSGLTSLELPVQLKEIGEFAFSYCVNIRNINFKTSPSANGGAEVVLDIGAYAFSNNHFLYTLTLPSSLNTLGEGVFSYASRLKYINFASDLNLLRTSLEIPSKAFLGDWAVEQISIPSYITYIGEKAFFELALDKISFLTSAGEEDLTLGDYAFANLNKLTTLELPDRLVEIQNHTFENSNISNLSFNALGREFSIGDYAFSNIKITSFTINSRISSIGKYAFSNNTKLKTVLYIGHTDLIIDDYTYYKSALSQISSSYVPQNLVIGSHAFEQTPLLTVTLSGDTTTLKATLSISIGAYAFYKSSLKTASIQGAQISIGEFAFNSTALTNADIEGEQISIGEQSLASNLNLSNLRIIASEEILSLGDGFASYNVSLSAINLIDPSLNYNVTDGVVYNKNTLLLYPAGKVGATYRAENSEYILTAQDPLDMQENYGIYYTREGETYTRLNEAPALWQENTYYTKAVNKIAPYAFAGNTHIRNLILDSGTTVIQRNALSFIGNSPSLTYFVPSALVNSYINNWAVNNITHISVNLNGMVLMLIINDRYALEKYTGNESTITIQSKIIDGDKIYNIVSIADEAFNQNISIKHIILGPAIETVGKYAFANCTNLISFTAGSLLTTIDIHAFQNCTKLETVVFNQSLKNINKFAFQNCIKLDNVILPDSMRVLGQYAFANCITLKNINLGNGLTTIMDNCFAACEELVSISLPASVTDISSYAFANCITLSYVYVNSLTVPRLAQNGFAFTLEGLRILVPQRLFHSFTTSTNWRDYSNKMLPKEYICKEEGFTDYIIEKISGTSYRLVGYLGNATDVTIVSHISDDIIITEIGGYAINHFARKLTISEGIKNINNYAFTNAKNLMEATLPSTLENIGDYAFANLNALTLVAIREMVNDLLVVPKLKTIGNYAFYNTALPAIVIPQKVTSIGNYAFSSNDTAYLTQITFKMKDPDNPSLPFDKLTIGSYAFANNIYLKSLTFDCFVERIGAGAFNNCTSLRNINFNSIKVNPVDGTSTKTTTETIFASCNNLSVFVRQTTILNSFKLSWQNNSDQAKILLANNIAQDTANSVIYVQGESGIEAVNTKNYFVLEIPQGSSSIAYIKNYIGEYTGRFIDVEAMGEDDAKDTDIVIPSSVVIGGITYTITQISAYAFNDKITSVVIPNTVTTISNFAFYNATSLKSVTFAGTSRLTNINISAFENCIALTEFTVPKSVISIGDNAFKNCTSLQNVYFEELAVSDVITTLTLQKYVFEKCTALTSITLPKHAIYLGDGVFKGATSLANVYFDVANSKMTTIRPYAFQNTAISTITFPFELQGVGDYAFDSCQKLTSVYLTRATGQPTNTGNNVFNNIPNPFIRVYVPFTSYQSYVVLNGWKTRSVLADQKDDTNTFNYILTGAVGNETAIITNYLGASLTLTVPSELKIGGNFYRVSSINSYAGNTKITKVEFASPSYVSTLSANAFANCTSLREVRLSDTITVMGENAFYGCTSLTDITLSRGISLIANRTFFNCTALKEITLPSNVMQIGEASFANCSKLNRVIVEMSGTTVASLGSGAFTGVSKHFVIVVPTLTLPYFLNEWYQYANVIFARNEMYGDYIIKETASSVAIVQYNGYTDNLNFDVITIKGKKISDVYANAFVDESLTYTFTK